MTKLIIILSFFFLFSNFLFAQNCQADFSYSVDTATNTVTFTDLSYTDSLNAVVSWSWDFGDGTSGNQQNESNTYNSTGTFYVCLTIVTTDSCSSTYCDSVSVGNSSNPCTGFYVTGVVTNESFQGANDGAIDITVFGGTAPFSYSWNNSSSVDDIANLSSGQYCVTVIDFNTCSYDTCFVVNMDNPYNCNALFSFSSGTCPNCFSFTDLSSASGTIVDWFWDFGNGNYSTLQNPQQTFLDSGSFIISLTITTSDSCISSVTDTVYTNQNIQTFSVTGQVFADTVFLPSGTAQLFSSNFTETHPPFYSTQIQNGTYSFSQVASGNYKLLVIPDAPESGDFQPSFFGDKTAYGDAFVLAVYSNLVSVDIHLQPNSNGISGIKNIKTSIYPNPFTNYLTIESQEIIQTVQVYSLTGELLFEKTNLHSKTILFTPEIPKGLYLLHIKTEKSVSFLKISKI